MLQGFNGNRLRSAIAISEQVPPYARRLLGQIRRCGPRHATPGHRAIAEKCRRSGALAFFDLYATYSLARVRLLRRARKIDMCSGIDPSRPGVGQNLQNVSGQAESIERSGRKRECKTAWPSASTIRNRTRLCVNPSIFQFALTPVTHGGNSEEDSRHQFARPINRPLRLVNLRKRNPQKKYEAASVQPPTSR